MRVFALDVGGTKFTVAGFDGDRLVLRDSFATDRSGGPATLFAQVETVFNSWRTQYAFIPDACGIGFGGPVDFPTQTVTMSTHVSGWDAYPLVGNLRRLTGAPVIMDNDANVGALGEAFHGAGRGCDPLFYMTLSTGIGGGIVHKGEVYRGADSYAGEIGHLNIEPEGPDCLCGSRGCFERMCCGLWLERDYGKPAHELLRDQAFVRRYVVHLARGLKAALMLLNPARIVIGGGLSKAGDALFIPLREELNRQMTAWSKARRDVVPAGLKDDSVLFGCLVLASSKKIEIT